ncbi:G protein-coupled receptor [Bovine gammaherpesvirus 6]|uniref:G protein-coupled receptor n=1 Tax=Bovine gammaherpesvirus 6 TaxID=1504288 RepID=A0A060CTZ1_9GAMA|nr:G protein-coupled receptor [Bovine gammaherpesvirus 6]AIB03167.1 G protein-coupled receptor [Bovine gammaherpesvirus 6]
MGLLEFNNSAECPKIYDANVFAAGNALQGLWALLALWFLYLFCCKLKLTPGIYLWLFFYTLGFVLWIFTKVLQDWSEFSLKCVITGALAFFCLIFDSLTMMGVTLDRCLAVTSRKKCGLNRCQICVFAAVSCFLSLLAALANALTAGQAAELGFQGNESFKCKPAATAEAYRGQLSSKGGLCFFFIIVAVLLTAITVYKVLRTKLQKKLPICINIIFVTLVNCLVWGAVTVTAFIQTQSQNLSVCPTKQSSLYYPYFLQLGVILILLVYLYSSRHLRGALQSALQQVKLTKKIKTFSTSSVCIIFYIVSS